MSIENEILLDAMNQLAKSDSVVDFESIGPPNLSPDGSFTMMPDEAYAITLRTGYAQELLRASDFNRRRVEISNRDRYSNRPVDYNNWPVYWVLHPQGEGQYPDRMFKLFRWQIGEDGKPRVTITNPYVVYKMNYLGTTEEEAGAQFADARSGMRYDITTEELSISGFDGYELVGCAPVAVKGNYGVTVEYVPDEARSKDSVSTLTIEEAVKALGCENHQDIEIIKEDIGMCLFVCQRTMPDFHQYTEAHRQVAYGVIRKALKLKGYEFNNANEFVDMVEKEPEISPFLLVRYQRIDGQDDGMLLALVRITQQRLPQERYSYALEITQFRPGERPELLSKYAIPKPR